MGMIGGKVAQLFRANLFRSQGPPRRKQDIAWKAPMTETFHTPERFGKLELVKKNEFAAICIETDPPWCQKAKAGESFRQPCKCEREMDSST